MAQCRSSDRSFTAYALDWATAIARSPSPALNAAKKLAVSGALGSARYAVSAQFWVGDLLAGSAVGAASDRADLRGRGGLAGSGGRICSGGGRWPAIPRRAACLARDGRP
jgi:hypothetical protein